MKICLLLFIAMTLFSGCYNTASIKRTPPRPKAARHHAPPPRKHKSDNPLFDAVFKHKPQNNDSFSNLSEKEKKLLRQNDVRYETMVNDFHDHNRKSKADRDNWVYGTGIRSSKKSGKER